MSYTTLPEDDVPTMVVHANRKSGGVYWKEWDIGLEIRGRTITDYDGCVELPQWAIRKIREMGYRFDRDVLPPPRTA